MVALFLQQVNDDRWYTSHRPKPIFTKRALLFDHVHRDITVLVHQNQNSLTVKWHGWASEVLVHDKRAERDGSKKLKGTVVQPVKYWE